MGPVFSVGLPFRDCPSCGTAGGQGLVDVMGGRALRRCQACRADELVPLPPAPTPEVLYLDQLAVSNLAKALHPDSAERFSAGDRRTQDGFWPTLYDRVERLVKAALLTCPISSIHFRETSLTLDLRARITRVHEHLSGGWSFAAHEHIRDQQLYTALCAWLDGGGSWR